ncbi:hypothetical protein AZA_14837 [Nitrospirillum viridazoti Y2]|nr:hypothetical protein AZA_14837 [Nitrospirillum amazonense Y2]
MVSASLIWSTSSQADSNETGYSPITAIGSGWIVDTVGVTLNKPLINPGKCPNTWWYKTDLSIPDNQNQKAMLVSARLSNVSVSLVIDGCTTENFPRIISVLLAPQ